MIQSWIEDNLLDAVVTGKIVTVKEVGNFLLLDEKFVFYEGNKHYMVTESFKDSIATFFDSEFKILLTDVEAEMVADESLDIKFYLFRFGDRYYYCDDHENPILNEFKFIGKAVNQLGLDFPFLGVHGGYDLCNGSRLYKDWCKKAKFLGINTLGIAEENTLAGVLDFQNECADAGIKSIIGETVTVKNESGNFTVKLYVWAEEGWKNLLKINSKINVDNAGFIHEADLLNFNKGLFCVIPPDFDLDNKWMWYFGHFGQRLMYQYDFTEWDSAERDLKMLTGIQNYLKNYCDKLPSVLISDAYYLDKADAPVRRLLNTIGKVKFKNNSKNQWFKSVDQVFLDMAEVFPDGDERLDHNLLCALGALYELEEKVDFKIKTKLRLPKYKMTTEEAAQYPTSMDLLIHLIQEGFDKKIAGKVDNEAEYWERIEYELSVIEKGEVIDYFLILWDIIKWCAKQKIWVGIGRGSAAGCMISYLLDIVKITDPIKFKLLFERFLNPGRIGKSLPDIDTDFQGERREEVKRYIEQRYGVNYVTSIGTYGTLKIKAALNDLGRNAGVANQNTKFVSKVIEGERQANGSFTDLFKLAARKEPVKAYIQKYPQIIEQLPLLMNQPKTASVHAAGVVIVPEEYGDIHQQMPVKKMDGILISEWEGEYVEKAGFLKMDILGIKQLDKFAAIAKLIEDTEGKNIQFEDIELDNERVYELFQQGYNEDVFQFGTEGLKAYCKKLRPERIDDLIAANALYRPGTMDTGMHEKYIKVKNGVEQPFYWFGCREITATTYGIFIYQEQIMKIVQEVGGFTLTEADDIRKAMGKKIKELILTFKDKFIEGAIKNGCPSDEAAALWDNMETFSRYGFNLSHATCYSIMGYYSQWFKVMYPLQFWTVALQFAKDDERLNRISEITKISDIKVAAIDINKSDVGFKCDASTNSIYWSINSVKFVGGAAMNDIQEERKKSMFFSLEEFVERTEGYRSINKRVIKNLIICGAFDEIERLGSPTERVKLLMQYWKLRKGDLGIDLNDAAKWKEHQWILMQKELSGSGFIDFEKIIKSSPAFAAKQHQYIEVVDAITGSENDPEDPCVIAGVLKSVMIKSSKNGKYAMVEIQDNTEMARITFWNEMYEVYKEILTNAESIGRVVILSGRTGWDGYWERKTVYTNKTTKLELL